MEQLERSALGLLSPCSHCLTVEEVVFRYLANTDWLSLIRSRIFLICSEDNLSTGGKHSASNSRMVVASIMPASYNPFAISCATFSMNDFSALFSAVMQCRPVGYAKAPPQIRKAHLWGRFGGRIAAIREDA